MSPEHSPVSGPVRNEAPATPSTHRGFSGPMKHNQRNNWTHNNSQVQLGSWTRDYQEQIQRVVRAGLEPEISGSQGKRSNHLAILPPTSQFGTQARSSSRQISSFSLVSSFKRTSGCDVSNIMSKYSTCTRLVTPGENCSTKAVNFLFTASNVVF